MATLSYFDQSRLLTRSGMFVCDDCGNVNFPTYTDELHCRRCWFMGEAQKIDAAQRATKAATHDPTFQPVYDLRFIGKRG